MLVEDTGSEKMDMEEKKEDKAKKKKDEKDSGEKDDDGLPKFFTHEDIGSDYFQVLVSKGRPSICKMIWWLISAILMAFCVYMVYKLLKGYFAYNSYDKIQVKWVESVALPAITLCSPNLVNYTHVKETINATELSWMEELIDLVDKAASDPEYNITTLNDYISNLIEEYAWIDYMDYTSGEWSENRSEVNFYEYFKMDPYYFTIFPDAEYTLAGKDIYMTYEAYEKFFAPHELGTCLQLNDDQKMVQTVAGSEWGLTIDLHANIADYIFSTTSAGFKLFLRNANETVLLQDSGYMLEPGTETFIKLEKKKVTRLKAPYGECNSTASNFDPTHMRTSRECNEHMKLLNLVGTCGCIPWYLARTIENIRTSVWDYDQNEYVLNATEAQNTTYERLKDFWLRKSLEKWYWEWDLDKIEATYNKSSDQIDTASICTFLYQQSCNALVNEFIRNSTVDTSNIVEGTVDIDCKESCKYDQYDVEITSSVFPATESYYNRRIAPRCCAEDQAYSFETARENFIRVHLFYGELTETLVEQEKAYEVQNFIAEFGGTVDLLIGISFFTLFQVGEIAVAFLIFKCCKRGEVKDEDEEANETYENKV